MYKSRRMAALAEMSIVWPLEFVILVVTLMFGASAGAAANDPTLGDPILFGVEFTMLVAAILAISDVILFLYLYLFRE